MSPTLLACQREDDVRRAQDDDQCQTEHGDHSSSGQPVLIDAIALVVPVDARLLARAPVDALLDLRDPVVQRLLQGGDQGADLVDLLKLPDMKARMADLGAVPVGSTAAQFGEFIRSEVAKYQTIVKATNLRIN